MSPLEEDPSTQMLGIFSLHSVTRLSDLRLTRGFASLPCDRFALIAKGPSVLRSRKIRTRECSRWSFRFLASFQWDRQIQKKIMRRAVPLELTGT